MHDDEYEDDTPERPSKSQLKREAQSFRDLGEELAALPRDQLAKLDLPEAVREAVQAAQAITAHGARKRQLKYLGGLLSRQDTESLQQAVAKLKQPGLEATRLLHRIESWRDRLLEQGDSALADLLQQYPAADSQALRQLIRNARREHAAAQPPKSARLLFKALRSLITATEAEENEANP